MGELPFGIGGLAGSDGTGENEQIHCGPLRTLDSAWSGWRVWAAADPGIVGSGLTLQLLKDQVSGFLASVALGSRGPFLS